MAETRASSTNALRVGAVLLGLVLIGLGALAWRLPLLTGIAADLVFGGLIVAFGVVRLVYGVAGRASSRAGISALLGVLGILAGVLLVVRPLVGLLALTLVLGGWLVAEGLLHLVAALQWRRRGRPWAFMLLSGLAAVVAGAIILLGWPVSGLWAVGLLVAAYFVLVGVGLVLAGLVGERAAPEASARAPVAAAGPAPA